MLHNTIATINIQRFAIEYQKAKLHLETSYVKQRFRAFTDHKSKLWIFHIELILSLMIYCNYDSLQCKFSETYRLNKGSKHGEFYYLAKYLKIAVKKFGKQSAKSFYHGIDKKLGLPAYIDDHDHGYAHKMPPGVSIFTPLSTSSSFPVAVRFTFNSGIIIEFTGKSTTYFDVHQFSNFPNEYECLFIQNGHFEKLQIMNIVEPCGYAYKLLLEAMRVLHDHTGKDGHTRCPVRKPIECILHKVFDGTYYTDYAKAIIDMYCKSKTHMVFYYRLVPKRSSRYPNLELFKKLFFRKDCEWINEQTIALFDSMTHIIVYGINITDSWIEHIVCYLSQENSKIRDVSVVTASDSFLTLVVDKHRTRFEEIGFVLGSSGSELKIQKQDIQHI